MQSKNHGLPKIIPERDAPPPGDDPPTGPDQNAIAAYAALVRSHPVSPVVLED